MSLSFKCSITGKTDEIFSYFEKKHGIRRIMTSKCPISETTVKSLCIIHIFLTQGTLSHVLFYYYHLFPQMWKDKLLSHAKIRFKIKMQLCETQAYCSEHFVSAAEWDILSVQWWSLSDLYSTSFQTSEHTLNNHKSSQPMFNCSWNN